MIRHLDADVIPPRYRRLDAQAFRRERQGQVALQARDLRHAHFQLLSILLSAFPDEPRLDGKLCDGWPNAEAGHLGGDIRAWGGCADDGVTLRILRGDLPRDFAFE